MKRTVSFLLVILSLCHCTVAGEDRSVVPRSLENNDEYRLAVNFLNHYVRLLESVQTIEVGDSIRRAKDNGLKFVKGNDRMLRTVKESDDFSLQFENSVYTASWQKDGRDYVVCSFPANIGLLTFSSKIDLEKKLIRRLEALESVKDSVSRPRSPLSGLKKISYSDFYVTDKGYYVTPRLKHQIVYSEANGEGIMMFEPQKYSIETLSNMILSGFSPNELAVHTTVSQYGYKESQHDVSYSALHRFLTEDGCVPYWGIDKFDGDVVDGVCIWINRSGGYAHVMNISMPIDALYKDSKADIRLHCYIRLDNVKSLFEDISNL